MLQCQLYTRSQPDLTVSMPPQVVDPHTTNHETCRARIRRHATCHTHRQHRNHRRRTYRCSRTTCATTDNYGHRNHRRRNYRHRRTTCATTDNYRHRTNRQRNYQRRRASHQETSTLA